jgi:type VI secretion system protein ImpA
MDPTPPLDIKALLAPIPGPDPAGEDLWYSIREKLDKARKEIRPEDFAADDPMRPAEPTRADWDYIVGEVQRALVEESKDLRLAARLTEALTKSRGFSGLRDGFRLMRSLVDDCWDRIKPTIDEDGDLGSRAAPFHWLSDENRGAFFPNLIRKVPVAVDESGAGFGWMSFYGPKNSEIKIGKGAIEAVQKYAQKAVATTPVEKCQADLVDLTECAQELDKLDLRLNAIMGEEAPSLNGLKDAVQDCLALVQSVVKTKVPATKPAGPTPAENRPSAPGEAPPPEKSVPTRTQVYQRLAEAAALLQEMEPHSPIPYLIRRAVDLGAMPFPQLMKALISDAKALDEMNRGLGIKEPPPEKK